MPDDPKDANKAKQGRPKTTKEKWKRMSLPNRLLIVFTAVIAGANLIYAGLSLWQLSVLRGQLNHMEEASHLDHRAWIGLANGFHGGIKAGLKLECELRFVNTGRTPAINVSSKYYILYRPQNFDIDSFDKSKLLKIPGPSPSQGTLSPGAIATVLANSGATLSEAEASQLISGTLAAYIFGYVRYKDVFGTSHETEYCYVVEPGTKNLQVYHQHNSMN